MRAATHRGPLSASFGGSSTHWARRAIYHLVSFEMVFALFFYSNQLKLFFPPLPVDETIVLLALSVGVGGLVILREGIYLRGLGIIASTLILFTWVAMSWGWSPSNRLALRTLTYIFTADLWCLLAGALILASSRERTARFLAIMLGLSMIVVVYGLYIYATYGTLRFFAGFAYGDISRIYLIWGYTATNAAAIAFALAIFSRMLSLRQLVAACMFGMSMVFLLVGSGRGPLLGAVVGCVIAALSSLPQIGRGRIQIPRWQLIAFAMLLASSGYVFYLVAEGTSFHTFGSFAKLLEQMQNPDVVQGPNRFAYYAKAIDFWLQAPIIGNGIGGFAVLYAGTEGVGLQPHNIILEMLSEYGLIGLALLLMSLWSGLRLAGRDRLRRDGLLLCVMMLFAARLLVAAMVSADISGQQELFLFLGMLALRPAPASAPHAHRPAMRPAPGGQGMNAVGAGGTPRLR